MMFYITDHVLYIFYLICLVLTFNITQLLINGCDCTFDGVFGRRDSLIFVIRFCVFINVMAALRSEIHPNFCHFHQLNLSSCKLCLPELFVFFWFGNLC